MADRALFFNIKDREVPSTVPITGVAALVTDTCLRGGASPLLHPRVLGAHEGSGALTGRQDAEISQQSIPKGARGRPGR